MRCFILALTILITYNTTSAAESGDPWAYFGQYQLEDGTILQGGLLEEGEDDLWIFVNPFDSSIGGLLYRPVSERKFESLLRPGETLEFSDVVDGYYQNVELRGPGYSPIAGRRAGKIVRRDVRIPAKGGEIEGSLVTPDCAGPHPVIVFVNGSGYTSRHIGELGTFLVGQGFAVLSYDKRDGNPEQSGWQEQSIPEIGNDAAAALAWAVAQPEADPDRTGIFGSSQGGWTGAMAAVQGPGADFLIVRAGPGVSELETHLYEVRQELRLEGLSGRDLDKAVDLHREIYRIVMKGEPIESTDAVVQPWLDQLWYTTALGEGLISQRWSARWWKWASESMFVTPIPYLERFEGPVLWFLGAEDENVPLVSSYSALAQTLAQSPRDDHRLVVLPGAPHSFVLDASSPNARYVDGYYSEMRDWLDAQNLSRQNCGH